MKRLKRSNFNDSGEKWFDSPIHKQNKSYQQFPGGVKDYCKQDLEIPQEINKLTFIKQDKETKLKIAKEKFYGFVEYVSNVEQLKIDYKYLNQNLNIKLDKILDFSTAYQVFEKMCSRILSTSNTKTNWGEEEIAFFLWIMLHYCHLNQKNFIAIEEADWINISDMIPGRNAEQCRYKWQTFLKVNISKVPWTRKEDEILNKIMLENDIKQWKIIAKELNQRTQFKYYRNGKQCRERWINHLDPSINRGIWSTQDDIKLLKCYFRIGKKWADIAKILQTRTENAVKNRWNSLIKKYKVLLGEQNDQNNVQVLVQNSKDYSADDIEKRFCSRILDIKEKEISIKSAKIEADNIRDSLFMKQDVKNQEEMKNLQGQRTTKNIGLKKNEQDMFDHNKPKDKIDHLVKEDKIIVNTDRMQNLNEIPMNCVYVNNPLSGSLYNVGNIGQNAMDNDKLLSVLLNYPKNQSLTKNQQSEAKVNFQIPTNNNPLQNKLIILQNSLMNRQNANNTAINAIANNLSFNDMTNLNALSFDSINHLNNTKINSSENIKIPIQLANSKSTTPNSAVSNSQQASADGIKIENNNISEDVPKENQFISLKPIPRNEFKINEYSLNNQQIYYAMVDLNSKTMSYIASINKDTVPSLLLQNQIFPSNVSFDLNLWQSGLNNPVPINLLNRPIFASNLKNANIPINSIYKESNGINGSRICSTFSDYIKSDPDFDKTKLLENEMALDKKYLNFSDQLQSYIPMHNLFLNQLEKQKQQQQHQMLQITKNQFNLYNSKIPLMEDKFII